jgi:hypothetical protein
MTVGELKKALESAPDEMLVGVEDQAGEVCKVQFAGRISDDKTSRMFFFIRANGGFPLFEEEEDLLLRGGYCAMKASVSNETNRDLTDCRHWVDRLDKAHERQRNVAA